MIDLDQQIRDGLVDASVDVGASHPADLASRLVAIRTRRRRTTRRRALAVAAAIVLVVGVTAAIAESRHGDQAQVITGPGEPKRFADLGPGWHVLDTGPVPGMSRAVLAWTGHELLVAGPEAMYAYDPNTVAWQRLAPPPFEPDGMVWTGEALVATGPLQRRSHARASAWWDPTRDQWHDLGTVPVAPGLAAAGSRGPTANDYGDSLVWTGQRVIDSTHGAVLDPASWRWSDLAMPADLIRLLGTADDQSRLGWSRARHQHLWHAGRFGLERPRHVLPSGPRRPGRPDGRGRGEPEHIGRGRRWERRARAGHRHGPRRRARSHHRDLDGPSPRSPACRRARAAHRSSPRSARTSSSPPATGPIRSSCAGTGGRRPARNPTSRRQERVRLAWSVAGGRRCGDRVVDEHGCRQRRRGALRPCRGLGAARRMTKGPAAGDTTLVSSGPWR